jgi:RNA polymerase sigma factor (sigma-70 family)
VIAKSKSENGGVVMEIVSYCSTSGDERFSCAQAGCKDCVEALLYENNGLAWTMIARQLSGNAEYADLHQEALLGLWRAILYFDTSRGIRFSTFACIAIFRGVRQAVQHSWKAEGWLEANRAGDSLELLLREWQAEQIHQALGEELDALPERCRQVIDLHYGLTGEEPQNLAKIGRAWKLSRERIRQLKEEALAQLRQPAFSIRLRTICERQERKDYRQALRQNQSRQRKLRGWR